MAHPSTAETLALIPAFALKCALLFGGWRLAMEVLQYYLPAYMNEARATGFVLLIYPFVYWAMMPFLKGVGMRDANDEQ